MAKKKAALCASVKISKAYAYEMIAQSGLRPKAVSSKRDYNRKDGKKVQQD